MRRILARILNFIGILELVNNVRSIIPKKVKRKQLHRHGVQALKILNSVFEKNGSFFWLEFGTLLGAYRDGVFIKHDFDIDLGAMIENRIPNLRELLEPYGFVKTREYQIPGKGPIEETYVYNGTHIDILYFYEEEKSIVGYLYLADKDEYLNDLLDTKGYKAVSYKFTNSGFEKKKFYNSSYYFPQDTDLHLRECYGNYKVEQKNWCEEQSPCRTVTDIRVFPSKI